MSVRTRLVIVGGVAGGASAAARARRVSEESDIVVFDRGPYVSFANCGLPYYVGDVIQDEKKLLVANEQLFRDRFRIDVRLRHEVRAIDRAAREVEVVDLAEGRTFRQPYDALILAPGASPVRPPLPGVDLPGVFVLRTIPDSRQIRAWLQEKAATRAVIVGAGFIGLEMAENLVHRGLHVSVAELGPQVLPPLDPETAAPVAERLRGRGVALHLGDGLVAIHADANGGLEVELKSGARLPTDLVVMAVGVRPEVTLAKQAGLELGSLGGIRVDASMRTNDPHIWAVGDAVEVPDVVTGQPTLLALAGPANRQGRIAADAIFGREVSFRGVQGTAVCGLFGLTVAWTGASERTLRRLGREYHAIYLHPGHHVSYYPGAKPIHLKLLCEAGSGRVLGAQAVGEEGVERRIDVVAFAIQEGATVHDLAEVELCYAPQYGAAKDPVNLAGMIAVNVLRGDLPVARWDELEGSGAFLLDVRSPAEFSEGSLPGAVNIPLEQLRSRWEELPRERPVWVTCRVGQRAYYAVRLLRQKGLDAADLLGGLLTYRDMQLARGEGR